MIPLYGFVAGDTLGLLLLHSAARRCRSWRTSCSNRRACAWRSAPTSRSCTRAASSIRSGAIEQAGIEALDRIDIVVRAERSNGR